MGARCIMAAAATNLAPANRLIECGTPVTRLHDSNRLILLFRHHASLDCHRRLLCPFRRSVTRMPVTWLHVSDFHIREGDPYDRNVVLNALVSSVRRMRENDGRAPDLIFA